jgi:hypothetical protein
MDTSDNRVLRWAVYNLAWWIVKRHYRRRRRRYVAAGVIGLVVLGGLLAARSGSE